MDNHPIPQDVTGFQFRLIGNMTVKQFVYVAVGAVLAWMIYVILPVSAFIKIPVVAIIGGIGVALAFLPIEGRPMDVMVSIFLKSLFSPNQYVFRKSGGHLFLTVTRVAQVANTQPTNQAPNVSPEQLQSFLKSLHVATPSASNLDDREAAFLQSLTPQPIVQQQPIPQQAPPPLIQPVITAPVPVAQPISFTIEPVQQTPSVPQVPIQQPVAPQPVLQQPAPAQEKPKNAEEHMQQKEEVLDLNEQMRMAMAQKQKLEDELAALQRKLESQKQAYTPTVVSSAPIPTTKNVIQAPTIATARTGAPPTPEVPNLITGVVKNPRGGILANILVEVKDKEGNPVRAFKTNQLGQFASATPLNNGIYTIEFEDPKGANKFDVLQLPIKGEIILPMEVTSIDAREELRRSLFN